MRRREVITLLGGAAAAWPLTVRAQQPERMRRIGVLMNTAADDPTGQTRLLAFAQALAQAGWTDGRNVRIDIRWGAGDPERVRIYAAELVALAPDVVLASGGTTLGPLRQVSRTIPTVWCRRSGRRRLCREPGAAGRQRDRLHRVRMERQRQMAGAA
jgi:putative tryptophan/tyrosine transport system substrate-binding protein